jgi:hypothetical protein
MEVALEKAEEEKVSHSPKYEFGIEYQWMEEIQYSSVLADHYEYDLDCVTFFVGNEDCEMRRIASFKGWISIQEI